VPSSSRFQRARPPPAIAAKAFPVVGPPQPGARVCGGVQDGIKASPVGWTSLNLARQNGVCADGPSKLAANSEFPDSGATRQVKSIVRARQPTDVPGPPAVVDCRLGSGHGDLLGQAAPPLASGTSDRRRSGSQTSANCCYMARRE